MQQYGIETESAFEMALVQFSGKVTVLPTLLGTRRSKRSCQLLGSSGKEQFFPQ